jgi:hypothetical protein
MLEQTLRSGIFVKMLANLTMSEIFCGKNAISKIQNGGKFTEDAILTSFYLTNLFLNKKNT